MITAFTERLTKAAFNRIRSAMDYRIIDRFALVKTERHYLADPREFWNRCQFEITYVKNSAGVFVAGDVYSPYGRYIVQGKPDILSGESDDILCRGGQFNGYNIHYGSTYSGVQRYGLIFSKWTLGPDGTWRETTVVVDYPKNTVVELDGKKYDIKIDLQGNISLSEKKGCVVYANPLILDNNPDLTVTRLSEPKTIAPA